MSHLEILDSELRNLKIDLTLPQKLKLAAYCNELVRWNQKINLTALTGADLVRRLVVEPVWIGQQLKPTGILADIGSGNGSPAIPLQIVCKFQVCHLIEARTKRAVFLRHLVAGLKLGTAHVHRARFESMAASLERVDWITLQGVALVEQLIDSIIKIASSTTIIVWITAQGVNSPMKAFRTLKVPFSDSQVLLFRLDLS